MSTHRFVINRPAFDRYCALAGLRTREQIATELGLDTSSITRVVNNQRSCGAGFMAAAIAAFHARGVDTSEIFTDLFDLRTDDTPEVAA